MLQFYLFDHIDENYGMRLVVSLSHLSQNMLNNLKQCAESFSPNIHMFNQSYLFINCLTHVLIHWRLEINCYLCLFKLLNDQR